MENYDFHCTKRVNITLSFKLFFTFMLMDLNIGQKNETFSRILFALLPDNLFRQGGIKSEMSTCLCHRPRERLSTYIFDTKKLKVLFLLNCESSKYIAKLFSLSI